MPQQETGHRHAFSRGVIALAIADASLSFTAHADDDDDAPPSAAEFIVGAHLDVLNRNFAMNTDLLGRDAEQNYQHLKAPPPAGLFVPS